jgi:hypothetical protein
MFNRVQKTETHTVHIVNKKADGRERLSHFDDEIRKGKAAIVNLEESIQRLETIIAGADEAHRALQAAIVSDGGKALADYSAGRTNDGDEINKLVMVADNSARAATAARASLPDAHSALQNAHAQVASLIDQRAQELKRVLATLGDVDARAYDKAFSDLCRLHDRMVGHASVAEDNIGDIRLTHEPLRVPRFAFPSMGHADADPFLRHQASDLTVAESARRWSQIRERLESDANADLSDLIGAR